MLQRLLATEPEVLLPLLTVQGGPVLELGRAYLAEPHPRPGSARRVAAARGGHRAVAELLARLTLSMALLPQTSIPFDDDAALRTFARHHIAPCWAGLRAEHPAWSGYGGRPTGRQKLGATELDDLNGKVAVVTGGAAGIGRGITEALLEQGARVVIADVEEPVLEMAVKELADAGEVRGVVTDVSSAESVEALAADVFAREGACHLLFNNAGVTSGGGGRPWEQEANDWAWCFSVNVFGVANGMLSFVPRMIESGEPGVVVNTSSMDGGIAPVPVRVGLRLEQGRRLLPDRGAGAPARRGRHRAAGRRLLPVGRAARYRPVDRAAQPAPRARPARGRGHRRRGPPSRSSRRSSRRPDAPSRSWTCASSVASASPGVQRGDFIIGHGLDEAAEMLHRRADAIGAGGSRRPR